MESDSAYFARRASEETIAANQAPDAAARHAHFQLALRYSDLAEAIDRKDRRWGVVDALRRLFHR